jgi:hypothetical protein
MLARLLISASAAWHRNHHAETMLIQISCNDILGGGGICITNMWNLNHKLTSDPWECLAFTRVCLYLTARAMHTLEMPRKPSNACVSVRKSWLLCWSAFEWSSRIADCLARVELRAKPRGETRLFCPFQVYAHTLARTDSPSLPRIAFI